MQHIGYILSGGPDSAVAAWKHFRDLDIGNRRSDGKVSTEAFFFQYGQMATPEAMCARALAADLRMPLHEIQMPENLLTSTMTANAKHRAADGIEPTFVPGRNMIFINMVAASLYDRGQTIIIVGGWNAADSAGYPDCRHNFLVAQENALEKGLDCEVQIHAPVLQMMKSEILSYGIFYKVPLHRTWSCYTPVFVEPDRFVPCGKCVSCEIRERGFHELGTVDPLKEVRLGVLGS